MVIGGWGTLKRCQYSRGKCIRASRLVDLLGFVIASTESTVIIPGGDSTYQTRVAAVGTVASAYKTTGVAQTPANSGKHHGAIDKLNSMLVPITWAKLVEVATTQSIMSSIKQA